MQKGKLIFTYSTMKAGKSLDMIRVHFNYTNDTDKKVITLKPSIDTRDSGVIRSRTGMSIPLDYTVSPTGSIKEILNDVDFDILLVDEANFLTKKQVEELHWISTLYGKIIMCWGIRIDFQNNGFIGSQTLLTLANEIREIKTVCKCGKKATHHLLYAGGGLVIGGDPVRIGNEEYESVCGECYYAEVYGL